MELEVIDCKNSNNENEEGIMKKSNAIIFTLSIVLMLISYTDNSIACSEVTNNKLHWESHDGFWAINNNDENIPEIPGHELKASPFEMAMTNHHWESRDGAWAIRTGFEQIAEATVEIAFIDQDHTVSNNKLHWESHDGFWAINNNDENIPEIPGHELKASPFDMAMKNHP